MNDDALRSILARLSLLETRVDRGASVDFPYIDTNTWTPNFQGSTIAGTFTYTAQYGVYTQLNNWVVAYFRLAISAITVAPTGNLQVGGLPVTSSADNGVGGIFSIGLSSLITLTANYTMIGGYIQGGTKNVVIQQYGSNVANAAVPAANLAATGQLWGSTIYRTV